MLHSENIENFKVGDTLLQENEKTAWRITKITRKENYIMAEVKPTFTDHPDHFFEQWWAGGKIPMPNWREK